MPISTPTVLNTVSQTTSSATITSGTLSPASNALLVVSLEATGASAATRLPASISDTFIPGPTWTKYEAEHVGASRSATLVLWVAKLGATPVVGTVTATLTVATDRRSLHSIEVASGYNTTTPVKQSKADGGTATTLVLTLNATPDSNSLVLAAMTARNVTVVTNDPDYTELIETTTSTNQVGQVQYDLTPTDTTVQWADAGTAANAGVAIEIDAAAGGTNTPKAVDGTLTSSGVMTTARGYVRSLAGTLTTAGAIVKSVVKSIAGTLSSSGALATARGYIRDFAGTLTSAGSLVKATTKALVGTVTSSGALTTARSYVRLLAGTLATAGDLVADLAGELAQAVGGTLNMAGAVTRQTGKSLAGTLTSAGILLRSTAKTLAGTLTAAGTLTRNTGKTLAGTLAPSGTIARAISKAIAGALSFVGTLLSQASNVPLLDVEISDSAVYTATLTDSAVYTVTLSDSSRS